MKRLISILLICTLIIAVFTGCDRRESGDAALEQENQQVVNFAPETTAVANADQAEAQLAAETTQEAAQDQPIADDAATDPVVQDATAEPASIATPEPAGDAAVQPFATPTPQPNTYIANYSEITNTGLGFKFSYPSDWNNVPGRSTVCYVQPLDKGTVYPARVAVTMKRLAHKCGPETLQSEMVEYIKVLMSQYDEKTFEVSKELDTETKFMGKSAISTTYLAYDGSQEIQGYVIATYFERYVFVYHFLSAYEDYEAFAPAMRRMRDSVQAEQTATASE